MFLRSAWTKRGQALADDWNDVTEGDALSHGVSRHPTMRWTSTPRWPTCRT